MSYWTRAYRLALYLLPPGLRRKHGPAMEELFARALNRARSRGRLAAAVTCVAGVWDIVKRAAYEQLLHRKSLQDEHPVGSPDDPWNALPILPYAAEVNHGVHQMSPHSTRRSALRFARSFSAVFTILTLLMVGQFGLSQAPSLVASGASAGTIAEILLLAVPFIVVLTIPMAVLVAVLWSFTRPGMADYIAGARHDREAITRLISPVLAAAVLIATMALAVTTEVLPRTNGRLATVLSGSTTPDNIRAMTIAELREQSLAAAGGAGIVDAARAAAYEVEVQKKLALPVATVVMALFGVAVVLRFPRGGTGLVVGSSFAAFGTYYALLVAGETLADRLVISPLVAMWGANVVLLGVALLAASGIGARRARPVAG